MLLRACDVKNTVLLGTVRCKTLFVMPFAPYVLTDNVIRANWQQLDQIAVIGNALRWCCDPDWAGAAGDPGEYPGEEGNTGNSNVDVGTVSVGGANVAEAQRSSGSATRTRSRAPCIEVALGLGAVLDEVDLWQGSMHTWISPTPDDLQEKAKMEAMVAATQPPPGKQGQGHGQGQEGEGVGTHDEGDGDDDHDDDDGHDDHDDDHDERWSRYSLDATLATFKAKGELAGRWPAQPPPRVLKSKL